MGFPSLDSTNQNDNKVIKKGTNPRLNVCRMAQIDWETIAKCLEETDNTKLNEELQSLKTQGNLLTQIVDQQGYTLIIHAVLQGKPGKVGYLILKTIELDNASEETI